MRRHLDRADRHGQPRGDVGDAFVAELAAIDAPRRVWFPMTFDQYGQVREFVAEMDTKAVRDESFDTHGASIFAYTFEPDAVDAAR